MARKIEIDVDECLACESCVQLCPEVFEMDDSEGKARVIKDVNDEEVDKVQDAIDTCPTECIAWAE
ncbi:MAG: ferredoxin [Proteobacteria bacterium]|nr:ferredoxin [Pseudomonadota bacterium]